MRFKYVTIIEAPISGRMWRRGQRALLDVVRDEIRVGGCWHAFDRRWRVAG